MSGGRITYSHIVAWLKVGLPLAALGLLSTLFLLARNVDTTGDLPFASNELQQRVREQQVTSPYFAGKTTGGHLIAFTAEAIKPDPDGTGRTLASELDARIDLVGGDNVTFSAQHGLIDDRLDRVVLSGDVRILSSSGMMVETAELSASMRELHADSPGPVRATGKIGDFEAGRMAIRPSENGQSAQLFFTNGVKLIYTPKD